LAEWVRWGKGRKRYKGDCLGEKEQQVQKRENLVYSEN
jgi:hypothetical protein